MPANINSTVYADLTVQANGGNKFAECVLAMIQGGITTLLTEADAIATVLASSGNTTFGSLPTTTLVLGKSTNGGGVYSNRTHTFAANVKAFKAFATVGSGAFDTVLEAHTAGPAGNSITVALVGDSPGAGGVTIARVGTTFIIHYESGVSTVTNVQTAITALAGADDLFDVKTTGTGATVLTAPADDVTATALAGGTSAATTIDEIITELEADAVFMNSDDIVLSKSGVELIITGATPATNIFFKIDATSTGLGANKLHFSSGQVSSGNGAHLQIQVTDLMGNPVAAVKELIIRALAIAGSPTFTIGTAGSIVKGSGTADLWARTDATGLLDLVFVNVTSELNLVKVQTDNGETELTEVTTPLS